MTEAIRIAVLNFVHETVTFLPNDTTLDDFVHDGSPARGEALLAWEPRSYMGGFVKVAREHAGVELVGIESPLWPETGTGSGWITTEAYEHFLGRMLAELEDGGRWHGVYLALHGAMGVLGVALPPRLRRFGLREDNSLDRAGAAVPRHGTARGATLPERRHLEVLCLRRRQLSVSGRRAPSTKGADHADR
jgi:hypothetical protein